MLLAFTDFSPGWAAVFAGIGALLTALGTVVVNVLRARGDEARANLALAHQHEREEKADLTDGLWEIIKDLRSKDDKQELRIQSLAERASRAERDNEECQRRFSVLEKRVTVVEEKNGH